MSLFSYKTTAAVAIIATASSTLVPSKADAVPERATRTVSSASSLAHTANAASETAKGKETFRAILFLQGEMARKVLETSQFDVLNDNDKQRLFDAANTTQAKAAADKVLREISAADPTFFGRFQKALSSGRPALVDSILREGMKRIETTPSYRTKVQNITNSSTYIPDSAGIDCGVAVLVLAGAIIVVAAAFAVNLGVTVNIAGGYNVAAGTNVYYQNNYTRTRSITDQTHGGNPYAAELAELFKA